MGKGHRWVIAIVLTPLVVIVAMIFIALASYVEAKQYKAPCRTVGHLQIPESECGR